MGRYIFRNEADSVRIDVYGDIGESYWDDDSVSAKDFSDQMLANRGRPVELHVNSGGGSVFDAYAMMTAIRNHDAPVTAHVDGLAASAASYLVAAADKVLIAQEAWMMVHDASGMCYGNRHDMAETADFLGKVDAHIASIYAKRAEAAGIGKTDADYAEMMDATTWFTASEAVENGLADEVEDMAVYDVAATLDKATLESAPDAVRTAAAVACDDAGTVAGTAEVVGQEADGKAQVRVRVFGNKLFIF